MAMIADNLERVRARIAAACRDAGRDVRSVTLLVVSKRFGPQAVREAFAAGARAFGENHVQEAVAKMDALADLSGEIEWHLIGPLQNNKTRVVAERFDWVHSVERLKTAERLSAQRPPTLPPLSVCLQVNVSAEASKSGIAPDEVEALAHALARLPHVRLRGLMAIPAPASDPEAQRAPHRALRSLQEGLVRQGLALDTLSMGMSDDLEAAIAEGATLVRIGTAVFGVRAPAAASQA
jgi:pyridoxal phosphate enzyme (YggS family)